MSSGSAMMVDQSPPVPTVQQPEPEISPPATPHIPASATRRLEKQSSSLATATSESNAVVDADGRPISSALATLRIGATPFGNTSRLQSALPQVPFSPDADDGPHPATSQRHLLSLHGGSSRILRDVVMPARYQPAGGVLSDGVMSHLSPLSKKKGGRAMPVVDFNRMVQTPRVGESRYLPPLSRSSLGRPRPPPEWIRESQFSLRAPTPLMQPDGRPPLRKVPVVGKMPAGLTNTEGYFRVFTEMKTIETVDLKKNGHHLAELLPHRYTRKMPLYGTSPRMMMMMQQPPPSRLAKLISSPLQKSVATYTKRAAPAAPAPKRGPRRLPGLAISDDAPTAAAEPDPKPPPTTRRTKAPKPIPNPHPKRTRKGGPTTTAVDGRANGAQIDDRAAADAADLRAGLATDIANASASRLADDATLRDPLTSADLKPWDTDVDPTPPAPPPPAPATEPTANAPAPTPAPAKATTVPTAANPQPANFTPYKPRRPTPPMQVSTNLSALRKTEEEEAVENEDTADEKDALGGLLASTPKSKFAGRNRSYGGAGFDGGEDAKKRRASFAPGMKKLNASSKKFDMDSLRKRRQSSGVPHRAGLESEDGKEDFLSSLVKDMNVMDEDSKLRYIRMSEPIFKDGDLISIDTLGAELTRMKWITAGEVDYITKVFELVAGDYVDQSEFCVIAALAERMTFLDTSLRQSFGDTDFRKLEKNIKQYRHLFTVNTNEDGKMTYDDLKILLLSTGLPANSIEGVAGLLNLAPAGKDSSKQSEVGFLDFLSYVPFFALLHDRIVDDPLAYNAGDENAAGGEAVVKKLLADMKSRSEAGAL
ncbi:hypothetical protein HDU89_007094 [Geranomyces variabilis]|nr:hypothetical protein HDU89_007094 [Geranomyces variabilis]